MMKIAVLIYSFIPHIGGAQIFTYNLIKNLTKRSHEVHLFLPYTCYKKYISLSPNNDFKVFPIFFQENRLTHYFPHIISFSLFLRQLVNKYDVWQVIGSYPAGYVAGTITSKAPVVLRSYGQDIQKDESLHYGARLNPVIEKRIKKTLSNMTRLVALTSTVKSCFLELGGHDEKIVEIPNAIDLERFQRPVERKVIRNKLGLKDDHIMVLTVGRYHIKKGYEFIPEAAKYLTGRGYNIYWLIVGENVCKIKPLVEKLKLNDVVILKEMVSIDEKCIYKDKLQLPTDSLIELYRSSDIFVMPSLIETFGMVLIEAMAAGLPVVTTDAPGCRDVIQHEVNGLLARPSDSISLGQNIERIINERELKERVKINSEINIKYFDWQNIVKKYENLYLELTQK